MPHANAEILRWLRRSRDGRTIAKSRDLLERMTENGSVEYARAVAARHAARAEELFEGTLAFIPESEDKAILRQVIHFANTRML